MSPNHQMILHFNQGKTILSPRTKPQNTTVLPEPGTGRRSSREQPGCLDNRSRSTGLQRRARAEPRGRRTDHQTQHLGRRSDWMTAYEYFQVARDIGVCVCLTPPCSPYPSEFSLFLGSKIRNPFLERITSTAERLPWKL